MSDVLTGWARAKLGLDENLDVAFAAMDAIDHGSERSLRACLRSFLADACLVVGDVRSIELLDQARHEAESRGEVWWLAEIGRLRAEADLRFGDGDHANTLLEEAEQLATVQGARLILPRISAMRESGRLAIG
jgi:predicted ATPase